MRQGDSMARFGRLATALVGLVLAPLSVRADEVIRLDSLAATSTRRIYTEVRVKAFDVQTNRVTILCREGMANLSIEDFPAEIRSRILQGPRLLNPVTATTPNQRPLTTAANEILEANTSVTVSPGGSVEEKIETLVRNRARGYFKFNYTPRGTFHHTLLEITCQPVMQLAGWSGRYRARGEVVFTLYDNKDRVVGTEIVGFEADVKVENDKPEILDFRNE